MVCQSTVFRALKEMGMERKGCRHGGVGPDRYLEKIWKKRETCDRNSATKTYDHRQKQ